MSSALVGQRRSFDGQLCTIRYVGNVQGTTGDWLGVEWDDATRGKHSGEHKGVRYFICKNKYSTAGSFVRPSRPSEPPRSFLEALHEKYASEFEQRQAQKALQGEGAAQRVIQISGKVVEEVGFDKIRKQLSELQELRIVLLDGLCTVGVLSSYEQPEDKVVEAAPQITSTCPNIIELDLSRSLLNRLRSVWEICNQLPRLRRLKLNGNRFLPLEVGLVFSERINQLHLEETLLTWDEIAAATSQFPGVTSLTASENQLTNISCPLPSSIRTLTLEYNDFTSISALRPLAAMPNLEYLALRGNDINTILDDPNNTNIDFKFSNTLHSLDISRNNISSWTVLNHLATLFPGLTTFRISGNPIYDQPPLPDYIAAATSTPSASKPMTVDEAFMLTLARFPPTLRVLNFSAISLSDRSNAEMYYLSLIAKELSATSEDEEKRILFAHPRYAELCEQYGEPTLTRAVVADGSGERVIHPRSVAARLIKMAFRIVCHEQKGDEVTDAKTIVKEIPTSFNSYQVKALVSRLFDLQPYSFKLVWETDEWDPVEKETVDEADWVEDSEDEMPREVSVPATDKSRFVRREVELADSTGDIGFLFQGETGEMKIRVEVPSLNPT
ncbi:hypothetical protein N7495_003801 [Penicillium taxi]|uniref:uncharacterized protein n=1 Tax=Penicillium taxi TaxID=168475 RepID=UPI00254514EE|nr:uncharacterized protein N7495_003801 [Penicillium taxi]KAJ5899057.1 hypothetical protein N7495_003801 [Penicillium taxi]